MPGLVIFEMVLGLAFILFSAIWYSRASARYRTATQLWHRGEATIIASSIRRGEHWNQDNRVISYEPLVQYSFGVAGERTGDSPFLVRRRNLRNQRRADAWLATVPVGATVPVWWDPANPGDSALELNRPAKGMAILFTALGVFLLVLGSYIAAKTMFHH